jgi:hypothetical protein
MLMGPEIVRNTMTIIPPASVDEAFPSLSLGMLPLSTKPHLQVENVSSLSPTVLENSSRQTALLRSLDIRTAPSLHPAALPSGALPTAIPHDFYVCGDMMF